MSNIKNTLSFAALICGLLIIFAAPQKASAQLNADQRSEVINQAMMDVYGWKGGPLEQATYDPQIKGKTRSEAWGVVYYKEEAKLKADKVVSRLVIANAFKKVMGRNPKKEEFDKWIGKNQVFRSITDTLRTDLYKPESAQELTTTIKRALKNKTGNEPTSDEIIAAMKLYSPKKTPYDEM